jgi:crotonobetainyl-CoA:carnitine CoA-transferase CaiB-like acyl-CoA transferase
MLDVTAYVDFPDLFSSRVFADDAPDDARSTTATALRTLPASDGAFVIAAVTGPQIKGSCRAVGHPEWAADLFATTDRLMETIVRLFTPVTATEPVSVWLERFAAQDVPVAGCLTIDQHLGDPQVLHNEIYAIADVPGVGPVRSVRYPAVASSWGQLRSGPPPAELAGRT